MLVNHVKGLVNAPSMIFIKKKKHLALMIVAQPTADLA